MRYCLMTAMVACLLVAIASSATAGYFINGWVAPGEGYALETLFTWYVLYQLEGDQGPPAMWLNLYDTGWGWGDPTQMQLAALPDKVVIYWGSGYLYYTAGYWGFKFWGETTDQWSDSFFGPTVYE